MTILDQIANPGLTESFLGGLKAVENIQDRRQQRYLQKIQTGMALQEMQAQQQALQQRQRGYNIIQDFMKAPPQQAASQAAPQTTRGPTGAAKENPVGMIKDTIQDVPTEQLEQSNYENLGMQLMSVPGFQKQGQFFMDFGQKLKKYTANQTKEEREQDNALYELVGGPFREIAKMEDEGNTQGARAAYETVVRRLLDDPRFAENDKVQQFIKNFSNYEPGLGKYMYLSSSYGKKARDQLQRETVGGEGEEFQRVNLTWPGQEQPVRGRYNPDSGQAEYMTPEGWKAAPADAQYVTTGLRGTPTELGLTKKNIGDLNAQIGRSVTTINNLKKLIDLSKKTPEAFGSVGAGAEVISGIVGQFGQAGEDISRMIESDDAQEIRTGYRMLTGQLVPVITGDTSGRYSDRDVKMVERVQKGLGLIDNKRQAINAMETVLTAFKNGQIRDQFALEHGRYPSEAEFDQLQAEQKGKKKETKQKSATGDYSALWGD